jgi:hypothetical protein
MIRAVALEVGAGGTNDDEVDVEVVLLEKEEVEVGRASVSDVGSSAGRLGVGATVEGRELVVSPEVAVVVPVEEGVSVGFELSAPEVEGTELEDAEGEEPKVVVVVEEAETEGEGGGSVVVESPEVVCGDDGEGVSVTVELDDGELGGIGDCDVDEGLIIGGPELEELDVGGPGGIVLLESEELLVLETMLELPLVKNDGLDVELVCEVGGRLGTVEGNELGKPVVVVVELTVVGPADVEGIEDGPEIDELGRMRLGLGTVWLLDEDAETVTDELVAVVPDIEILLADVLVT